MHVPWDGTGDRDRIGRRTPSHRPSVAGEAVAAVGHWRINGHPARVLVWTAEQWDRLERRPIDAQYLACGVWCALRVD